jgi:S1-C subfamily serine protease
MVLTLLHISNVWSSPLTDEQVFDAAETYTVEIKTVIKTPFIFDVAGTSTGAGFLVDSDKGWILTNRHVVSTSPAKITINFRDKDPVAGKRLYVDSYQDIAIVKIDPAYTKDIKSAQLMCDEEPRVGHPVGAFGHPWGLNYTGTKGVISGKTSMFGTEMLQTDAPINSGNSGGPLISLRTGKVVGMNTSNISDDDDQNTNFAESMKYACNIINILKQGKDPSAHHFPVEFFEENKKTELKVAKVLEHDEFGFEQGDVVIGAVGYEQEQDFVNDTHLVNILRGKEMPVGLVVNRGKQKLILNGELKRMPNILAQRAVKFSGVVIGNLAEWTGNPFFINKPVVHSVAVGSETEAAGMGDFTYVTHVNGVKVDDLDGMYKLVSESAESNQSVKLYTRSTSWVSPSYIEYKIPVADLEWVIVGGEKLEEDKLAQQSDNTPRIKLTPLSEK